MEHIPVRQIKTTKEPNLVGSFIIRNVSDLLLHCDMVQELHRHDFYFLLALKKGTGSHEIDFRKYTIGNFCIFFMRPGQVHQLTLKEGSEGFIIQANTDFFTLGTTEANLLLRKLAHSNYYQLTFAQYKKVNILLASIMQEYVNQDKQYNEVIKAYLKILFITIVRSAGHEAVYSQNLYMQEQLEKFTELLEKNVATHRQAAWYADRLNLSMYQLNSITRTLLSKSCSEVITDYILLEAKRHLLATSSHINEIAYYLGFEDTSYFIRFFKKHQGLSPEAFRQKLK